MTKTPPKVRLHRLKSSFASANWFKNLDAHSDAVWATSVVIGSGVAAGLAEKNRREALYVALANLRRKGLIEPTGDLPMAQAMQGRKKTVTA